jgi:hypothetical protein
MDVYADEAGEIRLVGQAAVPTDCGPVFEVPLFGPVSIIRERFTIGTVTLLPEDGGEPVVIRAVLLSPGQMAELLPGWRPVGH